MIGLLDPKKDVFIIYRFPNHVSIVGFLVASEFIGECKIKFRCVAKYPQFSSFVGKAIIVL